MSVHVHPLHQSALYQSYSLDSFYFYTTGYTVLYLAEACYKYNHRETDMFRKFLRESRVCQLFVTGLSLIVVESMKKWYTSKY